MSKKQERSLKLKVYKLNLKSLKNLINNFACESLIDKLMQFKIFRAVTNVIKSYRLSIDKILKSQKTISTAKTSLKKQFNLIFCTVANIIKSYLSVSITL